MRIFGVNVNVTIVGEEGPVVGDAVFSDPPGGIDIYPGAPPPIPYR